MAYSMTYDIFEFWSGLAGDACEHPADAEVLSNLPHNLKRDCLVGPYRGKLRDAP